MFQTQRFLQVEPNLASRSRPSRARPTAPGPARDMVGSRAQAWPSLRDFNFTDRRPIPVRDVPYRRASALPGLWHPQVIFAFVFEVGLLVLELSRPQPAR